MWPLILLTGMAAYRGEVFTVRTIVAGAPGLSAGRDAILLPGRSTSDAWRNLVAWYRAEAKRLVGERVATHAERLDLSPTSVAIHEWRARWGDCQPNGSVRFHWRFAMLPPAALDYVVVHELVHLREFNHSARFWRLLTQSMPEAKQWRAWFNVYGSPYLSWSAKLEPDTRSRVRDRDDLALAR